MNISEVSKSIFDYVKEQFGKIVSVQYDETEYESSPEYELKNKLGIYKNDKPDFAYEEIIKTTFSLRINNDFISALISKRSDKNTLQVVDQLPTEDAKTVIARSLREMINNPAVQEIKYQLEGSGLRMRYILIGPGRVMMELNMDYVSFDMRTFGHVYISYVIVDHEGNLIDDQRSFGKFIFRTPKQKETEEIIEIVPNHYFELGDSLLTVINLSKEYNVYQI